MATYIYPTSAELSAIEQQMLPMLDTAGDPLNNIIPMGTTDDSLLIWEQRDNFSGLMQVRGLNGEPGKVNRVGQKQYIMTPGVYGEFTAIDEQELTRRRQMGSFGTPIDISDLVLEAQQLLLHRQNTRYLKMGWDLLTLGTFSSTSPSGAVVHTDSYAQRIYTSVVPWTTSATATPLQDMRNIQLLSRGYSMRLDQSVVGYANRTTINALLSNTNPADLYGRRTAGLGTANSLTQVNDLYTGEGLPNLRPWDGGYYDDAGVFQLFIPNGTIVFAGQRVNGSPIARFLMTRNANNPGLAPGAYTKVFDTLETAVPRKLEVHRGFNGGIALYYPSSIIVAKVF